MDHDKMLSDLSETFQEQWMARLELVLQEVRAKIDEFGWEVTGVFPTESDRSGIVPFVYTVGLTDKGRPELIMLADADLGTLAAGLNLFAALVVDAEEMPDVITGEDVEGLRSRCELRTLGPAGDIAQPYRPGLLRHIYPDAQVTQVVWPDEQGLYPHQEGYDLAYRQPILYQP